jgi:RNA polymerase sigma-70 factor (ECF subfamily)
MSLVSLENRFCQLLAEHGKIVLKVANTYAFEFEDRRDLVQEIHAQLWRAFPSYDGIRPFSTWMYRVSLNVAVSHVRSERARGQKPVPLDDDIPDPSTTNELGERMDFLSRFIERQGKLDRALLLLYLEERSYLEISEILGISETNVATKVGRLKQRARAEAAKEQGDKK